MNNLEILIEELRKVNNRSEDYVQEFENILADIVALHNTNSVPLLVDFFDDDSEHDELMFSIIHSIEIFDDKEYVEEIIKTLPKFYFESPRWSAIVHMRILNSESTLEAYIEAVSKAASFQKDAVRDLISGINTHNPQFIEKTASLLQVL